MNAKLRSPKRLEYTSSNLTTGAENIQASEFTHGDADMAKKMAEFTKNDTLLKAQQAMLDQSNK